MIFLVGARRSGTNWLQRVVGAHPDVSLVPSETHLFSRGILPLRQRFHHSVRGSPGTSFLYMDEDDLLDALREFCDRALLPYLRAKPGASRLVERTPEHVMCLDLIAAIYPDAHVVHIVRDGRDVVRSLLSQTWPSAPKTVEAAAVEWRDSVEAAEAAAASVPRLCTVRYEELLADPPRHLTGLYRWLGLPSDPAIVEAALIEADVRFNVDPAAPQVAMGKWRASFSETDLATFVREAGATMRRLGYDLNGTEVPARSGPASEAAPPRRPFVFGRRRRENRDARSDAMFQREVTTQVTQAQRVLDRVVTAINTRKPSELRAMTTPSVWIRVVSPDEDWTGRGEAALRRLLTTIEQDGALGGRQVAGELYPALTTSVAVMRFVDARGAGHLRIVVTSLQGDSVSRLTYYRLPLS